jgi:hypothetical protein
MKNTFGLLLSVALGVSILMGSAQAKTKANPVVEVWVPFSFQVGNRTLPAGNYQFEIATGVPNAVDTISVLVVRNREARIYQALAVPVRPGLGLESESRLMFGSGEQHALVAVWEKGNRLDLQPAILEGAANADDWSNTEALVSVPTHLIGH